MLKYVVRDAALESLERQPQTYYWAQGGKAGVSAGTMGGMLREALQEEEQPPGLVFVAYQCGFWDFSARSDRL